MRRSMLFLPGNNPNMLINGNCLGADSVIFDLEDAVSPDEKDAARILVRNTMRYMDFQGCEIIVRINSIDTPYWQKDIDAAQQEVKILLSNYQTEQIFLSQDMKQKREEEILAKEQEVLELKRKYFGQDGEWYKKREALLKPIQDEIYNAIQDIANEKRYDVVKDRSADPSLIYMSSKLDISDQVLEKLGAK